MGNAQSSPAHLRAGDATTAIARALVEAELEAPDATVMLDAVTALRFLDAIDDLLGAVPHAAVRLAGILAAHPNMAVRRAVARAARRFARIAPVEAERIVVQLAADRRASVRGEATRTDRIES